MTTFFRIEGNCWPRSKRRRFDYKGIHNLIHNDPVVAELTLSYYQNQFPTSQLELVQYTIREGT